MNQTHSLPQSVNEDITASRSGSLLNFFILVFVLSIPFWLIGAYTGLELLPGLPIAALAAVCPMLAAVILVYRQNKIAGVVALLKRSFDFNRIKAKIWYVPTLLIMPLVSVLAFGVLRVTGTPVPAPEFQIVPTIMLIVGFFIFALGEELGWSGYAIDPMQERWGALRASLILGIIWAIYHYVGLAQAHRPLLWIAGWSLWTVTIRIIMVWLYNNTGKSVFAMALFHMTINVSWQLFPVNGSYFDPGVSGVITALIAVIIIVLWEPRTLTRLRNAR